MARYDIEIKEESGRWSYVNHTNTKPRAEKMRAKYAEAMSTDARIVRKDKPTSGFSRCEACEKLIAWRFPLHNCTPKPEA
jgi:hypothetical protein